MRCPQQKRRCGSYIDWSRGLRPALTATIVAGIKRDTKIDFLGAFGLLPADTRPPNCRRPWETSAFRNTPRGETIATPERETLLQETGMRPQPRSPAGGQIPQT